MTAVAPTRARGSEFTRSSHAEVLKLLSLPATLLTAAGSLLVSAVLAVAFATAGRQGSTGTASALDIGLAPIGYTQAGFIILGVLAATSEYTGGQVQTSLTVVPRRVLLHLSKVVALVLIAVPTALVVVLGGLVVANLVLGDAAVVPPFGDFAVGVGGAAAYLALTAVLSSSVATVIRRTVPAVAGLLVYYFIAGPLLRDRTAFAAYLPDTAGYGMWFHSGAGRFGSLSALVGTGFVVAWVVLAVAVAAVSFRARDA